MNPDSLPSTSSLRSTDTFTNASSPNTERAYKLAAKKLEPRFPCRQKKERTLNKYES